MGSLSILGAEIGEKHKFEQGPDVYTQKGWSTFYHRDRSDNWQDIAPVDFASYQALYHHARECWAEWVYVFNSGLWQCAKVAQHWGGNADELMPIDYYL